MQPFHVVILFFSICLLHGLLRAFYDTGKADASTVDMVDRLTAFMTTPETFIGIAKPHPKQDKPLRVITKHTFKIKPSISQDLPSIRLKAAAVNMTKFRDALKQAAISINKFSESVGKYKKVTS